MIKAVLFDLDGTLINTNALIIESFKHAFKTHLNMVMEEEKIVRFFGEPLKKSMESVNAEQAEALINVFHTFNEANHDILATRYEGAEVTIKALKAMGVKLGIVTSKRKLMTDRSLKLIGVYDYMDVIITPEDTEKHKPDGAPALLACERLGVKPEEALFVGDSIYDIQCGNNAGNETCVVTYSSFPISELMEYNPDYKIDKLAELVDIINGQYMKEIV